MIAGLTVRGLIGRVRAAKGILLLPNLVNPGGPVVFVAGAIEEVVDQTPFGPAMPCHLPWRAVSSLSDGTFNPLWGPFCQVNSGTPWWRSGAAVNAIPRAENPEATIDPGEVEIDLNRNINDGLGFFRMIKRIPPRHTTMLHLVIVVYGLRGEGLGIVGPMVALLDLETASLPDGDLTGLLLQVAPDEIPGIEGGTPRGEADGEIALIPVGAGHSGHQVRPSNPAADVTPTETKARWRRHPKTP